MSLLCSVLSVLTFFCCDIINGLQEFDWVIKREYLRPDCVEKLMITINGEFPGPEIRVQPNEEIIVNVYNELPSESITIHWHGQHQINSPFMDGISKISQCPIAPFSSFKYQFFVNDEEGTYFYHIHSGALIDSGAYGAFIITNDDNKYDEDFTMFVADHYHRDTYSSQFNLLQSSFRWVFDPNSIIINGKGVYDCDINDNYYCNQNETELLCSEYSNNNVCGVNQRDYTRFSAYGSGGCNDANVDCSYQQFTVKQYETYLFRIINPSPLSHLNIKIDQHQMKIVAIDSYPIIPIQVDSVDIHSGQRVDVEVYMNADIDKSYWMTAKIRSRSGVRYGPAIVRYENADSDYEPNNVEYDNLDQPAWDDYNFTRDQQNSLIGYDDPPTNDEIIKRFMLLSTQERFDLDNNVRINGITKDKFDISNMQSIIGDDGSRPEDYCNSYDNSYYLRWAFNRATWKMPNTPSLLSNVFTPNKFKNLANENYANYFKIEQNGIYDIVFQNYPACNGVCETHSIHLHGHTFWILGYFKGEWSGSQEQIDALCTTNCTKRDTAFLIADDTLPGSVGCGYTVIRFIANSPGVWPIHCHQSWHFLMGKVALFYYDDDEIELTANISDIDICGDFNAMDVINKYYGNEYNITTTEPANSGNTISPNNICLFVLFMIFVAK